MAARAAESPPGLSRVKSAAAIGSTASNSQPNWRLLGDDQRASDNAAVATTAKIIDSAGDVARVIDQKSEVPAKTSAAVRKAIAAGNSARSRS